MTEETIDTETNVEKADTPADMPENSDLPDGSVTVGEDDIDPSAIDAPTLPDTGQPQTTDGMRGVDPSPTGGHETTSDRATGVTTLRG